MANLFLNLFLSFFLGRSPETESTSLPHDDAAGQQPAVESPESVLLQPQQDVDLESGHLEAPSLRNQASKQSAVEGPDAAPLDHHVVAVAGGLELRPPRQQLSTTANNHQAFGVTEEQASARQRDRVSVLRAGESGQVPAAKLKEYLKYSFLIISVSTGTLVNLFFVRRTEEPLSKNPSLIVASASAFTSLISSFGLTFGTMRQMMVSPSARRNSPYSCLKLFSCMSTLSLAFTVLSIIVSFLPKAYYSLPLVLVPTLLVILIYIYDGRWRDHHVSLGDNDPHKDDRECSLQLTMNMTAFSFAGALGTVTGYYKNNSNRAMHVYVKVSIYFMFSAAITCLLILLLSRLRGRKDWKKIAVGNAIVLGLLVLAVLIVAASFLGGVLAGAAALVPVAIAVAIWYFVRCNVPPDDDLDAAFSQEEERKLMYTGAMTAMSLSFGAVMTTFAGFLGGQDKGGRLEAFIFFSVKCFVSSVILGVITFRAHKKASVAAAAIAMACLTMVLLVLAGLTMVSYVG